jgi:hypothetical protein
VDMSNFTHEMQLYWKVLDLITWRYMIQILPYARIVRNHVYDMYTHAPFILKGCTVYTMTLAPSKPTHPPVCAESSQFPVGL